MVHDIMWMLVNDSDMVYPGNGVMRKSFMNLVKTNFFFSEVFLTYGQCGTWQTPLCVSFI